MRRRDLIGAVAVGTLAGAGAGFGATRVFGAGDGDADAPDNGQASRVAAPALGGRVTRLQMVTSWPKGLPGLGISAERVGQFCREMSGGTLDIKVLAAGEMVGALEVFDAVRSGAADMYHSAEYYWTGRHPAYAFFTTVPFGMTAPEIMGWLDFAGGQALWDELAGEFGIIAMQAANTGVQTGGWFKREVRSLDDFRGLKMRIPGIGGEVVREMGGSAQVIPAGEVFGALQSGVIDAAEFVGPFNDLALGFFRVAPFMYAPGFHEPGGALAVGVNRGVWERLSTEHKAIIRTACMATNHLSLGEFHERSAEALDILVSREGVQVRQFPDDVVRRAAEVSRDVVLRAGSSDALGRRIYESWEKCFRRMRPWSNAADGGYYAMRKLADG
jgi:TRAP-type mannitol/chloroaromatic compound transport system substrate-binding protein